MSLPILTVQVRLERDVVAARRRARQIADLLHFDLQDRTRFATAVSEIARNAFVYGGGGQVEFEIDDTAMPPVLIARVSDKGPGIADLDPILGGTYRSDTGMGLGIIGTRRLMDQFDIASASGAGTTVTLGKAFPARTPAITTQSIRSLVDNLAQQTSDAPYEELQQQNQDMLRAMEELSRRQEDLRRLNNELEDTNRGVVALYAELDEKAEHLRRADELKSKFLSNMSHEFRTPLNSTLALTRLLLNRTDGDLTPEQVKQITFIRQGAESLIELVNDLLDIAKVEAGKIEVHPAEFRVGDLFGALRGMLRPLLLNENVNLVFEEDTVPSMISDEGKVAQILRNLISNALKFTELGEVRVAARYVSESDSILFSVTDTGIGIAPEHQESIFHEFSQLQNRLQSGVKGTGLGLPLSRRLAELLGGTIALTSSVGKGSTFSLALPRSCATAALPGARPRLNAGTAPEPSRKRILMIDDEEVSHYLIAQNIEHEDYDLVVVRNGHIGIEWARRERPDLILLDLVMPEIGGLEVLAALRAAPETAGLPVIIYTSKSLAPHEREWITSRSARILSKGAMNRESLSEILKAALAAGVPAHA